METTTENTIYDPFGDLHRSTDRPMHYDYLIAPVMGMSKEAIDELKHNQITFQIPSEHDLKHIDALHNFNTLLKRIGNVAYNTVATAASQHTEDSLRREHVPLAHDAAGQAITTEQIAKTVVLDLADLKGSTNMGSSIFERFFADNDMHAIINYLWIGVVTALIILSVIFILFSCYFYRKFREWKKCNKDIHAQLHGGDLYAAGLVTAGTALTCDGRLLNGNGQAAVEAAFYQIESPPCYTIATGLPTYDEALHRQNQQHSHFSYSMKFMYPNITALQQQQQQAIIATGNGNGTCMTITNWEKQEQLTLQRCKGKQQEKQKQKQKQQQDQYQQKLKLSTAVAPPAYADATTIATGATVALLTDVGHNEKQANAICIAIEEDNSALTTATAASLNNSSNIATGKGTESVATDCFPTASAA